MNKQRQYVEESFPMSPVGIVSSTEKSIRTGNIASFHTWWARRPSSTSRAINFATLVKHHPASGTEQMDLQEMVVKLAHWKVGGDPALLEDARKAILAANDSKPPLVLDPFGGGGAIPLEFLRLGCQTHTSDLNPVAVLILKCMLEYPQTHAPVSQVPQDDIVHEHASNRLVDDLEKWGRKIFDDVRCTLRPFYNTGDTSEKLEGLIWAKTLPCQNPSCGVTIPLMRQYWLSNRENNKVALCPYTLNNEIRFKIVGSGYEPMPAQFDPGVGSVKKAVVTCQRCGATFSGRTTKKLFLDKLSGEQLIAVVYTDKKKSKRKLYRISNNLDLDSVARADAALEKITEKLKKAWHMEPVPNEATPDGRGKGAERGLALRNYGFNEWGDLFNGRQKLALLTFIEKIRKSYGLMKESYGQEYAKVLVTYMALTLDRMVASYNRFTQWQANSEKMGNMFSMHAISMIWDYAEPNASEDAVRSWPSLFADTLATVRGCASTCPFPAIVNQGSATALPHSNDYFDAVVTDPPYYDNVPYSHLSDVFYVWLKRSVGFLYPDLFSTPLTPKSSEIVVYSNMTGGGGGFERGMHFFEDQLKKALQEICRVLKPDGIAVIVYAHKSTEGWETLINALLESGLVITSSWPLHTERPTRRRGQGAASLASSIYMVTRKWHKKDTGFYKNVKREMRAYLAFKLEKLWNEGISGADFLIAGIGSAIEVFGKYTKVINEAGVVITPAQLLSDTREIVTGHAINKVLKSNLSGHITPPTRFYILARWAYADKKIPFDEAHKLAQSVGIDITRGRHAGFIAKEDNYICVKGPGERADDDLEKSDEMIDLLHMAMRLWKSKQSCATDHYNKNMQENSHIVRRIAQAISASLPLDNEEKKWIDGFIAGFDPPARQERVQKLLTEVL